jgi:hypothetical protein
VEDHSLFKPDIDCLTRWGEFRHSDTCFAFVMQGSICHKKEGCKNPDFTLTTAGGASTTKK